MTDTDFSKGPPEADASRGVVVHCVGPAESAGLIGALRSAANAVAALAPGVPVEVVVQGPGVGLLAIESTLGESISEALGQGIRVLACGNSLRSVDLAPGQLLPGVGSVPAAIAHLATRQWEGWAYIRL
ncbi:DsrE family protein [Arthrobacter sp. H14-L1]|uniref:DsrE family protein n=1 Tax=Arthrobacter sp. H14-L1 TaxID=2996697 RepID=UPI0022708470|nr:DsrE family protein [Arthrobacter sp. H14-L1]MCY0905820.1 DsrE family protein [Arthrobacter sp. H14-L1]